MYTLTDRSPESIRRRLQSIPLGYSQALFEHRRYGVTHQRLSGGKVTKFYAEELGGTDHISFNLFALKTGEYLLKPCEMPEEKVAEFITVMVPLDEPVNT